MTGMDELITWLRAALDEDEQWARAAEGGWITLGPDPERTNSVGRHAARWDPARVLAEIDAKRQLLDLRDALIQRKDDNSARFVQLSKQRYLDQAEFTRVKTHGWELGGRLVGLNAAIQCAALPYADRPGYREEWAP